jgi:trehalose 6-phosphate phosphatase
MQQAPAVRSAIRSADYERRDRRPASANAVWRAALKHGPVGSWCVFLDVDGTLVDLEQTPDRVVISDDLRTLLARAARALGGALAIVSGRSLADLDALFSPLQLPAAGVHGLERRDVTGRTTRCELPPARLDPARWLLRAFADVHNGVLLEDKGVALAVHYRGASEHESGVRDIVRAAAAEVGPEFHVQEGAMVLEIKPAGWNKAAAVDAFMGEPPFRGRMPIFVGDDVTDRDGFMAVLRRGGLAVAVGDRVTTRWRLANPRAVQRWLAGLAATVAPD